jgi:hypothetical protein
VGVVGEVEREERLGGTTDDGGQIYVEHQSASLRYKFKWRVARERTKLCLRRVGMILLFIYLLLEAILCGGRRAEDQLQLIRPVVPEVIKLHAHLQ